MSSDKRLRQRQNRSNTMSMGQGGIQVPEHIAAMIAEQQRAEQGQQGPTHADQRRGIAVQVAISSFGVGFEPKPPSDEDIARRTKLVDELIQGTHEVYKVDAVEGELVEGGPFEDEGEVPTGLPVPTPAQTLLAP